ncbi:hypothetical protein ILT44_15825 [Microvirga sp. BT689]|uniref:DUF6262 family protein n=1 Tax=Microvirga arvi TaxID=2778731 RepID=UPI0019517005|nr:DUF6262 family protein [Microvirga arvi]MBM6581666.1 hypothetical protein [Microvirga arvi]
MTDPKPLSGAEAGAENLERLRRYLAALQAEGKPLPERNGRVNVSAVALACGFDRQVLYKNPAAKAELDAAVGRMGLETGAAADGSDKPAAATPDRRDRRIHQLEQENAALRAEVAGLREQIRRMRHVEEHMTESGRRVAALFPSLGGTGE